MTAPPSQPTPWTIFSSVCEFVGPVTVGDYDLDAVTDFKLNIRPAAEEHPPTPTDIAAEWLAPDNQDGDYGLLIGPGGTVVLDPGIYRLASAYKQGGVWQGARDIGVINIK